MLRYQNIYIPPRHKSPMREKQKPKEEPRDIFTILNIGHNIITLFYTTPREIYRTIREILTEEKEADYSFELER